MKCTYRIQSYLTPLLIILCTNRPDILAITRFSREPRQHRNISSNNKQFNVQIERLMFCKAIPLFVCTVYDSTLRWAISRNATLFVCTLYHSTLRWAISRNATPYVCTLYHSRLRWAISRNGTPFVRLLCYSTLPWAIWRNATPFVYCIANECQAIRNWASFMFQFDIGN